MTVEKQTRRADGKDESANADNAPTVKKSAAQVVDEYYRRRAIMYKEMYEHGSTSR